ncbi:DsbC family protein [Noviherbaspirillum pedocola]|uniref:Thiol:disulfide interchange protein n=1 Tax=Noviherbaspirillum pedocola TaxID=2801341 RepID=A0A934SX63_9BURK|nr:DsbC family protein [Noviherbaspirillum pedocola]MBK4738195.1 DsbC family protein [Noviherbaspirillum pedocola]
MLTIKRSLAALALLVPALSALAENAQEAEVRKLIQPRLGPNTSITSVTKTPYSGLFEVRVGNELFYTDGLAKYLFIGRILDANTTEDYTKARVDEINKIKFSDLPLDAAIKTVKGNGKRVIAVFEDPNCGYCKRFRHTLKDVDNVTVYTFLYNILSPDSADKSRNVWCAPNRAKAWDDWMLDGKAAPAAPASCNTPNDKVFALGQNLHITGTPTIFFTDGTRIPGAIDAKGLEAKFASVK